MRAAIVIILVILVVAGGFLLWRSQQTAAREPAAAAKQTLYVAVPMGLYVPYTKVVNRFQAEHPNVEFKQMVDTPETMAAAVEENADKPDIFISPGGHEITVLREKGLVDPATMVAFGSYEAAILVPRGNPGHVTKPGDLLNPEVKVISFSYPDMTAASHASRQALQNLGLWDKVKPKIKYTGCCNESFLWIVGSRDKPPRAEANVQFLGCPVDPRTVEMSEKTKVEIACTFPRDTYYVPRNVAGIVTTTKNRKLAEEFLAFLTSPAMLKLMAQNRMWNDQNLPLTAGPWGPEQEAGPRKTSGS